MWNSLTTLPKINKNNKAISATDNWAQSAAGWSSLHFALRVLKAKETIPSYAAANFSKNS